MGNCTSDMQCLTAGDMSDYPVSCPKCDQGIELDFESRLISELTHQLILKAIPVPDADRQQCQDCGKSFMLLVRRHHCRACQDIFCDECSSLRIRNVVAINSFTDTSRSQPQRICRSCFHDILFVKCGQNECEFEFCLNCKAIWHEAADCPPQMEPATLGGIPDFSGGVLVYPSSRPSMSTSRTSYAPDGSDPPGSSEPNSNTDNNPVPKNKSSSSSPRKKTKKTKQTASSSSLSSSNITPREQQQQPSSGRRSDHKHESSPASSVLEHVKSKVNEAAAQRDDEFDVECIQCNHRFVETWPDHKTYPSDGSLIILDKSEWVPNNERKLCGVCCRPFTIVRTRHHCRVCGDVFCAECSDLSLEGFDPEEKADQDELIAFLRSQPVHGAKVTVEEELAEGGANNLHRVCHGCWKKVMCVECPKERCAASFCMYCEKMWIGHDGKLCEDV